MRTGLPELHTMGWGLISGPSGEIRTYFVTEFVTDCVSIFLSHFVTNFVSKFEKFPFFLHILKLIKGPTL